ncbi:MAG: dihydropteroate synthase [Pseudomonadota bacterium]
MTQDPFAPRAWRLAGGRSLALGPQSVLMGIINATPDSFSDGGVHEVPGAAAQASALMVGAGAAIIDIGAESTRPGATEIDQDEEQARLLPVLGAVLASVPTAMISVDTYRASTAEKALKAGAVIVNDVWGLQREPALASIVADHGAGVVIMHTSRDRTVLPDVVEDQKFFFDKSLSIAARAGIKDDQIVLDPGFGFGKQAEQNFDLMARFEALHAFGFPLLAGTSRKRFIGSATGRDAADRDVGTAATTALLRAKGAAVFRVHNVADNADAARLADAMIAHHRKPQP